ncbi:MAG: hydrogenase iron-sulfur subunit [Chloroflexi bacterium]|nr:hydrogenase iron-sulfur subunit [Chloroflexota bacterium]
MFHCVDASSEVATLPLTVADSAEMRTVRLPCAAIVQDVYLLRAFEAGSDAVVVLTCAQGQCRYGDGNTRAEKRVGRVRSLLDEIGLGGRRLALFSITPQDKDACAQIVRDTLSNLDDIGLSPAAHNGSAPAKG